MWLLLLNTFISGNLTRKLESHLTGKCHADCTSRYDIPKLEPTQVKSVADMLLQNIQTKRLKAIKRNQQYVSRVIKILSFITNNRWSMSSFENVVKIIGGLEPPALCQHKSTIHPLLNYILSKI